MLFRKVASIIVLFMILLSISSTYGDTKKTPDVLEQEITMVFGKPNNAFRSTLEKSFGSFMAEDELCFIETGTSKHGFWIVLNSPDTPDKQKIWMIKNPKEEDYKKAITIIHNYSEGYGVAEDNRCWYFNGSNAYVFFTNEKLEFDQEFNDIDVFLEYIINQHYPNLSDWYVKEFSK